MDFSLWWQIPVRWWLTFWDRALDQISLEWESIPGAKWNFAFVRVFRILPHQGSPEFWVREGVKWLLWSSASLFLSGGRERQIWSSYSQGSCYRDLWVDVGGSDIGKSKNGFLNSYMCACMFIYGYMQCSWEHRLTYTHVPRVLFFRMHLPDILRWGPALGLIEPAARCGWPARPRELPVPASPAHWVHACITPRLLLIWVLGRWIQGFTLVWQACYPTVSHPSSPGLGFEFKWACVSLRAPGSRQSPWNTTGYLNGFVQDFISPLPPWLSSNSTCHVLGEAQYTCSEWKVELTTKPRWFLIYG